MAVASCADTSPCLITVPPKACQTPNKLCATEEYLSADTQTNTSSHSQAQRPLLKNIFTRPAVDLARPNSSWLTVLPGRTTEGHPGVLTIILSNAYLKLISHPPWVWAGGTANLVGGAHAPGSCAKQNMWQRLSIFQLCCAKYVTQESNAGQLDFCNWLEPRRDNLISITLRQVY